MLRPHPYDPEPFRREELMVGVYRDIAHERKAQADAVRADDAELADELDSYSAAYYERANELTRAIEEARAIMFPKARRESRMVLA